MALPAQTLMFGEAVTLEIKPGTHKLRANNTLFWKSARFNVEPGEHIEHPSEESVRLRPRKRERKRKREKARNRNDLRCEKPHCMREELAAGQHRRSETP
jgi:hypothetical protein